MNRHRTKELAAILVEQYGRWAISHARRRRAQHAQQPCSEAFRLWHAITVETARLLRSKARRLRTG
jgi:hypothetical protein